MTFYAIHHSSPRQYATLLYRASALRSHISNELHSLNSRCSSGVNKLHLNNKPLKRLTSNCNMCSDIPLLVLIISDHAPLHVTNGSK